MPVYMIYRLQKDVDSIVVRIGQTTRLRERIREHFSHELRAWKSTGQREMLFLRWARVTIVETRGSRREALRAERRHQRRAEKRGWILDRSRTASEQYLLSRPFDGTGRKRRKRSKQQVWRTGQALHYRALQKLLMDRRTLSDDTRATIVDALIEHPAASDRAIAKMTGAGRGAVSLVRQRMNQQHAPIEATYVPGEKLAVDAAVAHSAVRRATLEEAELNALYDAPCAIQSEANQEEEF